MPVATAWAPPHDLQTTCVTRPVGSPPLKISEGLTCPNPWPCAKTPAGWPSVGTAADGPPEAGAAGEEVVVTLIGAVGEAGDAVVGGGVVVALRVGALGAAAACETAEQPAAARPAEAMATAAQRRREAAAPRPRACSATASWGAIPRGEPPVFLALFMSAPLPSLR